MRQWTAWFGVLLLGHVFASDAAELPPTPNLVSRSGWVRLQLVLGRIEVAHLNSSQTRSTMEGEPGGECLEKLLISSDMEVPGVRYECVTHQYRLTTTIIGGDQVEIHRQPHANSQDAEVQFLQRPGQPLLLCVGSGSSQRRYRAASLWHLILAQGDDFATHLAPLLEAMQPSWRFDELAEQVQSELMRQAESSSFTTHRQVRKLIVELDDDSFSRRREVDQKLRQLGVTALPSLSRLDPSQLSREQRARVTRIRRDLTVKEADTPERVSAWLVEDETIWLTLLDHEELSMRRQATQHLAKWLLGPFPFDPAAEPGVRMQQVAELKRQLQLR